MPRNFQNSAAADIRRIKRNEYSLPISRVLIIFGIGSKWIRCNNGVLSRRNLNFGQNLFLQIYQKFNGSCGAREGRSYEMLSNPGYKLEANISKNAGMLGDTPWKAAQKKLPLFLARLLQYSLQLHMFTVIPTLPRTSRVIMKLE